MRALFMEDPALTEQTAFRNGALQGAYLMIATRAVGPDCGPMSGFDSAKVDAGFFIGTPVRSNFVCNFGRGKPSKLLVRSPSFAFDEVCQAP